MECASTLEPRGRSRRLAAWARFALILGMWSAIAGMAGIGPALAQANSCVVVQARVTSKWGQQSAYNRYYRVNRFQADGRGGLFEYDLIGQDNCAGRWQRFTFDWVFDRDLAYFRTPEKGVAFNMRISGQGAREDCVEGQFGARQMSLSMGTTGASYLFPYTPDSLHWAFADYPLSIGKRNEPFRQFSIDASNRAAWAGRENGFKIYFMLPSLPNRGGDDFSIYYHFDLSSCPDNQRPTGPTVAWPPTQSALPASPPTSPPPRPTAGNACGLTLGSGIYAKWQQMGGERGILNCPVAGEADAARSPYGTPGRFAEFRGGGYIVWHGAGQRAGYAYEVHGCNYLYYKQQGGTAGWLGLPISDEYDVPGGRRSDFEGGFVVWDARTRHCQGYRYPAASGTTGARPPGSQPPTVHTPPAASVRYLGCFRDQGDPGGTSGRDLNGYFMSSPAMTVQACASQCAARGFAYAGLQFATQCFCGQQFGRSGPASNCDAPCSGNAQQACGGVWANSVYAVGGGRR